MKKAPVLQAISNIFSRLIFLVAENVSLRDGPLVKLMGRGGGRVKYKKKYSRKGKINEENSYTPISPKNIHATA